MAVGLAWRCLWAEKQQDRDKSIARAPEPAGDAGRCHTSPRVTATRAPCRGCQEELGGREGTERPLSCLAWWWLKVTGRFGGDRRKDGSGELQGQPGSSWVSVQRDERPAEPWIPFEIRCLYRTQGEDFLPEARGMGSATSSGSTFTPASREQHRREQKGKKK